MNIDLDALKAALDQLGIIRCNCPSCEAHRNAAARARRMAVIHADARKAADRLRARQYAEMGLNPDGTPHKPVDEPEHIPGCAPNYRDRGAAS